MRISIFYNTLTNFFQLITELMKRIITLLITASISGFLCAQVNRNIIIFRSDGKLGYKDSKTDSIIIPSKYEKASPFFYKGVAAVDLHGKAGLIDTADHIIVPFKYDVIFGWGDDLAWVMTNHKFGFIDTAGNEVIPLIYDKTFGFYNGLACVKMNNKWGYIDKTGKVVVPIRYDFIQTGFSSDLVYFNIGGKGDGIPKGGKWGYVDRNGKEVIPAKYDKVSGFGSIKKDAALVFSGNKKIWIDKNGERIKQ